MTKDKPKAAKAAKPPAERTIKSFFKLLETGRADDVAKQVAKLGANLRYNGGYGEKPALVVAAGARRANVECTRILLEAGADLAATSSWGDTALHAACREGNDDVVALLLRSGASIVAKNSKGETPYAVSSTVQVRTLLRAHGDPGFGPRGGHVLTPKVHANAKNMEIARGALGVDREGKVWFAGYSGLFCYDGKAMTRYTFEETFSVTAVGAGPPGVTYFATNWGLLELKAGVFTLFTSEDSELFDHHVTDLATAPDGRAYMLSYESEADHKHITVFDGTTFTILAPGVDFPEGLEISCLSFDADGKLAIGADEAFATQRDAGWHVERDFDDVVSSARVYDAIVERDTTWLATSHGLVVKRGDAFSVQRLEHAPKTLCRDGDALWIGFWGGIGKLVGDTLTTIAKEDSELPDESVERIVRATDGRVWIHAGAGVAYVEGGEVRRFD